MEKPVEPYYEVFLSFRGSDTRNDIADYLYHSLTNVGIRAFRDDEQLHVGKEIGPELLQAIKQSKISIPIFSERYAESEWCLMELVQMVECKEKWGQEIMQIFYDVKPSEVRDQIASYGKAIRSHITKQLYTDETIQNWKAALNKVGSLKGWKLKQRGKGEFTKEVVQMLLIKLKKNSLAVSNCLVEMDNQVDKFMEVIGERTTETQIIGIHGMGGVGKTTLATIIYNKLSADFYNCCFLSNVRDTKIETLQDQLISKVLRTSCMSITNGNEGITEIKERLFSKTVLLVLDDVDQKTQLDALVGADECRFGRGSKVIITTRDKELLKGVDFQHELIKMDFKHSLKLFSKHAFRRDNPPAEYVPLSKKALKICDGLPLALKTIGSLLNGKERRIWEITLKKLETIPNGNVKSKLNISFEALESQEKEIFLDICCFFVGYDVRIVIHIWDSYKFSPEYSLEVLEQRSLIKIVEGNRLWVHDQLRDLGRDIVRERANLKPEKQSRVWNHEEAIAVLQMKEGTKNVEAICLTFDHQSRCFFKKEEFASLPNLRFLQVECGDLDMNNVRHFSFTNWFRRNLPTLLNLRWLSWSKFIQYFPSTNSFQRNLPILQNLKYISWHEFPIFFQFTAFSLVKLAILDLSRSKITYEWEGWNHLKMAKKLKVLNLTGCYNLHRTPNFSDHKNLEQLILKGCYKLVQVDKSIGKLKHLVLLNLEGCRELQTLPDEMEELKALTELRVGRTSITNFPEWKGMEKMETLSTTYCKLLSECNLASCSTSLLYLDLSETSISELPFGNFGSLVELNLSQSSLRELPDLIKTMKNLRVLRMSHTPLEKLPGALGLLEKLEEIHVDSCRNLCGEIPNEIERLSFLRILRLSSSRVSDIPKLPESMTDLYLEYNVNMRCPNLSNLLNLRVLTLESRYQTPSCLATSLDWIGGLTKLETLWLRYDNPITLPSDFNLLSKLGKLKLCVHQLECPPRLPQNLSYFVIYGGRLMDNAVINLSYLEKLSFFEVYNCVQVQGLEHLKNLKELRLSCLVSQAKLLDLTNSKKLRRIHIESCPKLVEVRGQLESLEDLTLFNCKSLEKMPNPLSFKYIKSLYIDECQKLEEIQGPEVSENLRVLCVGDLPLLEKLPDLTNAKELEGLKIRRCPRQVEIRGRLESLKRLEIWGCESLRQFSDPSSFKELEDLIIRGCERLEEILESDEYRDLKKARILTESRISRGWWAGSHGENVPY
ncbi:hypothetical protein EUGRSUZ_J01303 [Eucalyptus grandis]|uniref:Uncharacterized protein n=2 Tax=Eucalyptus grandis TaxID=71139 RepID=A0ACC3K051_EUCGR|nr:hypothetical protein EUGRSUZ_J01303 [Eucalyptus grandis]